MSSHRIKVKVHILDSDEEPVGSFQYRYGDTRTVSGSVQVDTSQDVDRSLELVLNDPHRRLLFDPDSPAESGAWAGYFLDVTFCVLVPHYTLFPRPDLYPSPKLFPGDRALAESGTWVHVPVFQGPITHYESSSGTVELEGQGKESLALAPHYAGKGYVLEKGMHVDEAIRHVLERIGERKFAIPDLPFKLKRDRVVHPQSEPWRVVALGETDAAGNASGPLIRRTGVHPHMIYFDGRGKCRVKRRNKQPVHTFGDRWLLSEPTVDHEGLEFINRVVVRGQKPAGKGKHRVSAEVVLPRENPLSPWHLARGNGEKPSYRSHYEDTDLDTERKCRERGRHILANQSVIGLEANFDCLPLPMLEPFDVIRVRTDTFHLEFPVRQFTLPLTSSEPMTIGHTERVPIRPRVKSSSIHPRRGAAGPGGGRGGSGGGKHHGGGKGDGGKRHGGGKDRP